MLINIMKPFYIFIALIFLLGPLWTPRVQPNAYEGGRSRNVHDRLVRNSSAVAVILGEARASTSDMLFIKTERYLDYGVAYEPHLDEKLLTVSGEAQAIEEREGEAASHADGAHDHAHDHGEEGEAPQTIIRTVDRDFRGIIGELERRVQPWRDPSLPHNHASGEQMLPWYRVMTLADPQNGRAYSIGSWWLKQKSRAEAIAFVEEGLKNNPEYFQLWYTYGVLLYEEGREHQGESKPETGLPPEAQKFFDLSKEACLKATEIGLKRRPAGWIPDAAHEDNDTWTLYEDEDLRAAARFAVLIERIYGDKRNALTLAIDLNKRLEGDGIIERQIPYITRLMKNAQIAMTSWDEWTHQLHELDELSEAAANHIDKLGEQEVRDLAARLIEAAGTVGEAAFPAEVENPVGVELAQHELIKAVEKFGDPAMAPVAAMQRELPQIHRAVERLMLASGMEHSHDHDHDDEHDHDEDHEH